MTYYLQITGTSHIMPIQFLSHKVLMQVNFKGVVAVWKKKRTFWQKIFDL